MAGAASKKQITSLLILIHSGNNTVPLSGFLMEKARGILFQNYDNCYEYNQNENCETFKNDIRHLIASLAEIITMTMMTTTMMTKIMMTKKDANDWDILE